MMITEKMMVEDEKRWHARNIVTELGYCGTHIRHRKSITNDDIRFYAYIMRKAHALLKDQELQTGKWILDDDDENSWKCSKCGSVIIVIEGTPHENDWYFCPYCGAKLDEQAAKWK